MKVLITGDLHCQKGIRTDICIEYLNYIEDFYFKQKIDFIFFAGDIFEKSNKINHDAFVPLFKKFLEMKERNVRMIFILGNHDIYNCDNNSVVETFSPFGEVIKDYARLNLMGNEVDFLSYTKNREMIPTNGNVLITHLDISTFCFDNEYKVQDSIAFPPEIFEGYNIVFTGHYHKFQNKKNIVYQGGPYQLNFGEAGTEKGFVVYDFDNNSWEFNKYTLAPEFLKLKVEDFGKVDVRNKFISIEINTKIENYVKLKHILYEKGALEIVPYFKTEEESFSVADGMSFFDPNCSIQNMVRDYLTKYVKLDNLDNGKLIEYFEEVLKEI